MEGYSLKAPSIVFVTTESGCFVPISHKLNQDGYFRKRWKGTAEMFHRFIWRAKKGEIPEGYEINHLCGCRSCSNVDHMECITGTDHAIKTNQERYAHEQEEAKQLWNNTKGGASRLAEKYGWRAYGWVRKWKQETH